MKKSRRNDITRRTVLKGVGSVLAAPILAGAAPVRSAASGHISHVPEELARAVRAAWAEFEKRADPADVAAAWRVFATAHQSLRELVHSARPVRAASGEITHFYSPGDLRYGDVALMLHVLTGVELELGPVEEGFTIVTGIGTIIGFGKYMTLDPGWLTMVITWLKYYGDVYERPKMVTRIPIADDVSLGLVGDWGTGFYRNAPNVAPAENVAGLLAQLMPDYSFHLGDVYYTGLPEDNLTQFPPTEGKHFLDIWPRARLSTFALNSNHDMYPGAYGFFGEALASPKFEAQQQSSIIWLENTHWIILGLDSAYSASWVGLYGEGHLEQFQLDLITQAASTGKRILLMCHHNGLEEVGTTKRHLWNQIVKALDGAEAWWYWGHAHLGTVYTKTDGIYPRCSGHGGIACGRAEDVLNSSAVEWCEEKNAGDPDIAVRVMNGLTHITLNGRTITEVFFDEKGTPGWDLTTR